MDATVNGYRLFHKQLIRFEDECPSKLKPDSPAALSNIRYIHQIVTPDDQDFQQERADRVQRRVKLVIRLTHIVLGKIVPHIRPGEHWWVRAKLNTLGVYSSLVEISLVGLGLEDHDCEQDVQVSSSGAGGLNLGHVEQQSLVDNQVLQELRRLFDALN